MLNAVKILKIAEFLVHSTPRRPFNNGSEPSCDRSEQVNGNKKRPRISHCAKFPFSFRQKLQLAVCKLYGPYIMSGWLVAFGKNRFAVEANSSLFLSELYW
jgi:hypothetical protein